MDEAPSTGVFTLRSHYNLGNFTSILESPVLTWSGARCVESLCSAHHIEAKPHHT
jgi:hypothetical protein